MLLLAIDLDFSLELYNSGRIMTRMPHETHNLVQAG